MFKLGLTAEKINIECNVSPEKIQTKKVAATRKFCPFKKSFFFFTAAFRIQKVSSEIYWYTIGPELCIHTAYSQQCYLFCFEMGGNGLSILTPQSNVNTTVLPLVLELGNSLKVGGNQ